MDAKSNPNMDIFGKGREVKAKYDLRKMWLLMYLYVSSFNIMKYYSFFLSFLRQGLAMQFRQVTNSWSSYLSILSAKIK
jgi:hypothetical protein